MTKPIKLGEFLNRVKVPVRIDPSEDYSLVTVKLYHKGVILREKKKGALLGSNMYRVSAGHFILSGIDARNRAFGIVPPELDGAIVTNDFWYFDVDETKVKRDFFFWLTNTPLFLDACIKSSKGETQRIRLQKDLFYNFEFHFPPVERQEAFLKRIQRSDNILGLLGDEVAGQSKTLTQLRQAILQEAIEGKLTVDWREKNLPSSPKASAGKNPSGLPQASHLPLAGEEQDGSEGSPPAKGEYGEAGRGFLSPRDGKDLPAEYYDAAALLEKIKAEKAALIAKGKIKKEKSLPPIESGEVPFTLPEGWVWTRLGEIGIFGRGKSKHRPRNDASLFKNGKIPFVQTGEVARSKNNRNLIQTANRFYNQKGLSQSKLWPKGTLCITIAANIAETGFLQMDACFPDSVVGFTSMTGSATSWFVKHYLFCTQAQIIKFAPATAQKNINLEIIGDLLFPLPPLAEQHAIVERVDKLLAIVDQLEQQVAERKVQAAELMQAVLREAFG